MTDTGSDDPTITDDSTDQGLSDDSTDSPSDSYSTTGSGNSNTGAFTTTTTETDSDNLSRFGNDARGTFGGTATDVQARRPIKRATTTRRSAPVRSIGSDTQTRYFRWEQHQLRADRDQHGQLHDDANGQRLDGRICLHHDRREFATTNETGSSPTTDYTLAKWMGPRPLNPGTSDELTDYSNVRTP